MGPYINHTYSVRVSGRTVHWAERGVSHVVVGWSVTCPPHARPPTRPSYVGPRGRALPYKQMHTSGRPSSLFPRPLASEHS
eukprot:5543789-Prymnesium_polylepis.2